jgi:hypothetical protein
MQICSGATLYVGDKQFPVESITLPGVEYPEPSIPRSLGPIEVTADIDPKVFDAIGFIEAALQLDEQPERDPMVEIRASVEAYMARLRSMGPIYDYTVEADPDDPSIINFSVFWQPPTPIRKINLRHIHKLPSGESTRRNRRRRRGRAQSWLSSFLKF